MNQIPTPRWGEGDRGHFVRTREGRVGAWPGASCNAKDNSSSLCLPFVARGKRAIEERHDTSLALLADLRTLACSVKSDPTLRLNPDVVEEITDFANSFKARIGEYSAYQIILGVTSFAMIGYRDEELFQQVHDRVKGRGEELSISSLADLGWSCGTLLIRQPALLDIVRKAALRKERNARMTDHDDPRSVIPFKERALLSWCFAAASPENARQNSVRQFAHEQDLGRAGVPFKHWHLMFQSLVIAGIVDGKDHFPILDALAQCHDERAPNHFETSVLHSTMNLLGEGRRYSYHIHKRIGGVETDLMVSTPQGDVVIESDGEAFHRLIGPDGGMLRGKDHAQDLFLSKLGVTAVIHIGSWEWDPLWGEDILRDKLRSAAPFLLDRP